MFHRRDGVAEEERVQPPPPFPSSILQRIISAHVFSARDSYGWRS